MKIIYIHFHFAHAGFGNDRSSFFCKDWASRGAEVIVLAAKSDHAPINGFRVHSLHVAYSHQMPFIRRSLAFVLFFLKAFKYLMYTRKPDLIYASSSPMMVGILAYACKKIRGIPYFFETVDLWPDVPFGMAEAGLLNGVYSFLRYKAIKNLLWAVEKKIYTHADKIITLSEGMSDRIIGKGIDSEKISCVPNGTDCTMFIPCKEKASAKIKLGLPPDKIIVLYAGTIGVANGCSAIVDIAIALKNKGIHHISIILLGDGNDKENVAAMIARANLGNIHILPAISKAEVYPYFDAADIGMVTFAAIPILETNSANKFYDYLAAGLPVCINYEGWQKKYLEVYTCGLSTPQKNIELAIENMLRLASDASLRNNMGTNARQLAEEQFDRKNLSSDVWRLLQGQ